MTLEQSKRLLKPTPAEEFGLTKQEQLFDQVSHERLLAFVDDEAAMVHRVEENVNHYGEFMFVKLSRPGQERRIWMSFWGLGYHEQRERWLVDEWFHYRPNVFPGDEEENVDKEEVKVLLQNRHKMALASAGQSTQSKRGKLFEALADLVDEDGAYAEMQDLDGLAE